MHDGANGKQFCWHSRGYLPHFDGPLAVQHVTFHLADSLPKEAFSRIAKELENLRKETRKLERRRRLEDWIDAGHGSCLLRETQIAALVESALLHFDHRR